MQDLTIWNINPTVLLMQILWRLLYPVWSLLQNSVSLYVGTAVKHNCFPEFTKTSQATLWPGPSTGSTTCSVTTVPATCALPCTMCLSSSISCWMWFLLLGPAWLWPSSPCGSWYVCWRGRAGTITKERKSPGMTAPWQMDIVTVRAWPTGNTKGTALWKMRRR